MPENWIPACPLSALRADEMVMEELDGEEVVLAEVEGKVYAFDGICTHALGYLDQGELSGHQLLCPLHEGLFDIRTGEVISGPPEEPICVYRTKIEGDTVYVNKPES